MQDPPANCEYLMDTASFHLGGSCGISSRTMTACGQLFFLDEIPDLLSLSRKVKRERSLFLLVAVLCLFFVTQWPVICPRPVMGVLHWSAHYRLIVPVRTVQSKCCLHRQYFVDRPLMSDRPLLCVPMVISVLHIYYPHTPMVLGTTLVRAGCLVEVL